MYSRVRAALYKPTDTSPHALTRNPTEPDSGRPLYSHVRGLWCESHAKCEIWQPCKHNLMRSKRILLPSVVLMGCTLREVPRPRMIRWFGSEVHYRGSAGLSLRAAVRPINPRHSRTRPFALCNPREGGRLGVVYQGPSCPCGTTSKPLVSHAHARSIGWGLGCQGNSQSVPRQKGF